MEKSIWFYYFPHHQCKISWNPMENFFACTEFPSPKKPHVFSLSENEHPNSLISLCPGNPDDLCPVFVAILLRRANVHMGVSASDPGGGDVCLGVWQTPPDRHPPPGQTTPWADTSLADGQQAGGTHPTRMHSCGNCVRYQCKLPVGRFHEIYHVFPDSILIGSTSWPFTAAKGNKLQAARHSRF